MKGIFFFACLLLFNFLGYTQLVNYKIICNASKANERSGTTQISTSKTKKYFLISLDYFINETMWSIMINDTTYNVSNEDGFSRDYKLKFDSNSNYYTLNVDQLIDVIDIYFTGDSLIVSSNTAINISNSKANFIKCHNDYNGVSINKDKYLFRRFFECEIHELVFDNTTIKGDYFGFQCNIDIIKLNKCKFDHTFSFAPLPLPKKFFVRDITFKDSLAYLDFTDFWLKDYPRKCDLYLWANTENNFKLKFNYENYFLKFDSTVKAWESINLYQLVNQMQLKYGYIYGQVNLDKDFKSFKHLNTSAKIFGFNTGIIFDWIDKYWWDYGYKKYLVLRGSGLLFFFFTFINIFLYSKLLEVYKPLRFQEYEEKLAEHSFIRKNRFFFYVKRIPSIALYTAYIFWGIRLNLDDIHLKKPLILSLVFLEYLIGIICLSYIANLILSH